MREKVGKSRNTVFFQWFGAAEGWKVGSLKRRVRSQLARWEMKKCTPLWREAHVEVKMYNTHHSRTTFRSWDVEKVHAVVARSTFRSQNVQSTPRTDHFWTFRALHSTFHFLRKSRRIASFLMLSSSKIEEVSQNCFVFDVVKFKNWGSLAELLCFWCWQVQKLRKSRIIASFWMLPSSTIEEVSQNCCVFKLTVRLTDRQTDRQTYRQTDRQTNR